MNTILTLTLIVMLFFAAFTDWIRIVQYIKMKERLNKVMSEYEKDKLLKKLERLHTAWSNDYDFEGSEYEFMAEYWDIYDEDF